MQSSRGEADFDRGQGPSAHGGRGSKSRNLKLSSVILVCQIALYARFCDGFFISDEESGRAGFLTINGSSNCAKTYKVNSSDSCASVGLDNNVSQHQLLLLNPDLNCKDLREKVCVQGIPPNCKKKVHVLAGQSIDGGCENIAAIAELTLPDLLLINPGIICPDVTNQSSLWSSHQEICVARGPGSVFIEYMGASGKPITFSDIQPVVKASKAVFHIALGFVIEYASDGTYVNGTFSKNWNDFLTPEAARAFKMNNPGVRLLMSLGGDSLWVNDTYTVFVEWFDPPNPDAWIDRAQTSLTYIAGLYRIDGIDIDFEHFPANYSTSNSTFTYCIGTLIERLKGNNTIGVATIAPFRDVIQPYQDLAANYGDLIDYISFQFYADELTTVADYVQMFRETTLLFDSTKLLASTLINGNKTIMGRQFLQAVTQLQEQDALLGVMLYDADASKSRNFSDEIGVLAFIPGPYDGTLPSQAPSPVPAGGSKALVDYQWRWQHFSVGFALIMYSLLHL